MPEQPQDEPLNAVHLLKEYFFLEAGRVDQRTDWFLIFHAILFEAFVASPHAGASGGVLRDSIPGLPLGILGILSSYYWWVSGRRAAWLLHQLGGYLGNEQVAGKRFSTMWNLLYAERRKHADLQWARAVPLFLVVLPFIVMLIWFTLTLLTYTHWLQLLATGLLTVICILASRAFATKLDKPFVPPFLEEMQKALKTETNSAGT